MNILDFSLPGDLPPQQAAELNQEFSKRLAFALNPLSGNTNLVDRVSSDPLLSGVSLIGDAYDFSGSQANEAFSWGVNTYDPFYLSEGLTIVLTVFRRSTTDTKYFGQWGSPPYGWVVASDSSGRPYIAIGAASQIEAYRADISLAANTRTTVVFRWDGTNGAGGYKFWIDGRKSGTSVSVVDNGNPTYVDNLTSSPFQIGRDTTGAALNGKIYSLSGFFGGLTDSECSRLSLNPYEIFRQKKRRVWVPGGGGTQTLTPSLFTNTNTFYSPTVGRGAVTLTPSLFTSATNAFYSATITQGGATQTLTPSLFSNSQSFYSATVTPGGVSLAPSLLTNGQTFYAPTVTPGSVTLTPSLFTSSTNAFYAPTVTQEGGPQYLTVPLVSNTSEFYAPTVAPGAITITPDLFANAQTFYAATVSQGAPGQTLEPELFSSTNQFFTAIVTVGGVTLTPSLFTNSNTFYAHLLTGGEVLVHPAEIIFSVASERRIFSVASERRIFSVASEQRIFKD